MSIIYQHIIKYWIPLAVGITLLCGLVYVTVQQNYRQSANDPQIQIVEDVIAAIAGGQKPEEMLGTNTKTDITKSLAVYVIIYDTEGKPIASTAQLDGKDPVVSKGVLDIAKANGENRITWQPKENVRSAIVVKPFTAATSGFVLVGRSLREIEQREGQMTNMIAIALAISLVATLLATVVTMWVTTKLAKK
ncbi:MAG TPA: hypothetical protein VJC11_01540 [Patescibacteria group bacterium]|nr:hypothetical protein [Patescibacteria group bacterium]